MPERDNYSDRTGNESGGIISYINRFRFRDRNPASGPLDLAPEVIVIPEDLSANLDLDIDPQTASEEIEASDEDWDISWKISREYAEEFSEDREMRSIELELANEFNYAIDCRCPECTTRRKRAIETQKEREKVRKKKNRSKILTNDKEKEEFINGMRSSVDSERMDRLECAQSSDKLWEYLRKRGADKQAYFRALISYMPDDVFDRMTRLPSGDDVDPIIKYLLTSISAIGKMGSSELKFGRLIERAYGSVGIERFAGTAGLTAYAFVREFEPDNEVGLNLIPEHENELKERIVGLRRAYSERINKLEPMRRILSEPLRYGIEIECNASLLEISAQPSARQILSIAGWKVDTDINGSYEYKSNPTEDIELLGEELGLMEELGLLPFDVNGKDPRGLRLAHGVHLTTSGIVYDIDDDDPRSAKPSDIRFLHHTDEATGFMSAFPFGERKDLARDNGIYGELRGRSSSKLEQAGNTFGVEQRTFTAYDRGQFMEGLRSHVKKTQALAAFQLLPVDIREKATQDTNPYDDSVDSRGDFVQRMRYSSNWDNYLTQIKDRFNRVTSGYQIDPLIQGLAWEWVNYRVHAGAVFKAGYLMSPYMNWLDYDNKKSFEARAGLFNRINGIFEVKDDYFEDPASYPVIDEKHGQKIVRDIRLGSKRFANFVHAIRSIDSMLAENVEKAIGRRYDTDI